MNPISSGFALAVIELKAELDNERTHLEALQQLARRDDLTPGERVWLHEQQLQECCVQSAEEEFYDSQRRQEPS